MAKIIYRDKDGNWVDDKPADDQIVARARVPDNTMLTVLNHRVLYTSDDWDETLYRSVVARLDTRRAISYLQSTDYIVMQWLEEQTLGVEHYRSEADYMAVLQKRAEARQLLRTSNIENISE
jgi:hypothetical protein